MAIFISGVNYSVNPSPLPISEGGTGQATAPLAINALLPTQSGQSGKVLGTDGTNVSWVTGGGGGPAAAGTLTGTTLAANVVTSSLTSLGTLTTLVVDNTIRGIDGSTTGTGTLAIRAGIPSSGTSGLMSISGGSSASGSSAGDTTIEAGHNSVSGNAGTLLLSGGNQTGSTGTGLAGDVIITGGYHQSYGTVALNGGNVNIYGGNGAGLAGVGGSLTLNGGLATGSGGPIVISTAPNTALVERLRFLNTGAWSVGSSGTDYGTTGQVLTSNGNTSPTWQTISAGAAAAGTLTGTTLASNVVSSSLTSVGTLSTLNVSGTVMVGPGTTAGINIAGKDNNSGPGGSLSILSANGSTNGGALLLAGGYGLSGSGGVVVISGGTGSSGQIGGSIVLQTAPTTTNVQRLRISESGTWLLGAAESAGTSGQVLTSAGAGSAPTWQNAAAGTLTGSTLAAGVTASSLTSIGVLTGLDVNADSIIVRTAKTPASATDTGVTGQIAWDSNFIYVCVATNTWKKTAIATW